MIVYTHDVQTLRANPVDQGGSAQLCGMMGGVQQRETQGNTVMQPYSALSLTALHSSSSSISIQAALRWTTAHLYLHQQNRFKCKPI
ncbi:hypothetical protein Y1Q_0001170 [Alligator mississippiensis]|uniref:Uncharacterized protein n=1 Tax=Alligator mississippiensis TaxID=8496 RepID=A0A151PEB9_ALLMI|nr:hypothetical protein Y1Q_0001170 [Alligator mississippiensis]